MASIRHSTLHIGNWAMTWLQAFLTAVSHNRPFHRPLGRHESQVAGASFLRCLPGVGSPFDTPREAAMPRVPSARLMSTNVLSGSGCCESDQQYRSLLRMQTIGAWAMQRALECYNRTRVPAAAQAAILHFRCSDAPFSRHTAYHFLRYSGWRLQIDRLLAAGKLQAGDALHVVGCFHHESETFWEAAYATRFSVEAQCRAYAEHLVRHLANSTPLAPSLHECEHGMVDEFVAMLRAPAVLSAASSMSFVAGYFGRAGTSGAFQAASLLVEARSGLAATSSCKNKPTCPEAATALSGPAGQLPPNVSGVVVTSAGGAGTTSLLLALRLAGLPTNTVDGSDGLKHMRAARSGVRLRRAPPPLGTRPLLLFLYDDPVRATLSFARRGWANFQAFRLEAGGARFPKPLQNHRCVAAAKREFIDDQRRRREAEPSTSAGSESGRGSSEAGEASLSLGGHFVGNESVRSCSETVALRGLSSPGAAEDWIGLERHWDEWVAAACAGRLRGSGGGPPLDGRGAVCLVGFLRTFASPPVYVGIARAARALGDVDVFAVVANGAGDTAKGQAGAVPSEQVAAARAHLQPREWVTAQPEMALPAACPNCLGQLAKFEQCMALVRSAERRDGGRYTWVVKMRPDCVPCGDVPPVASLRRPADNVALAAGGDLFVLYPRPLAEAVASGWRRVDCRRHHRVFGGNLTGCNHVAEAALRAAGGQSRTTGQFDCDIVRTAEGARSMFQFGKYALHGALWGDVEGWTPNRTLYKGSGVVAATATRFCGREWGGSIVVFVSIEVS
ncbi:hypothetical protein EMIHUDRAFT_251046 [Emiliania huxleyi CCMP1516]|uniref:Uncharacterized protein n=2 Tax=Emiliania huxleyi TaxID=2903 RepID=A0A0D3KYE4_EMIH1|nr:hypothetical protein EMIHUDRAFT_251046 [Emiliania huxleyi CCMP1516]EOD40779.1 hypothetical protein EMIHUDRAFT_251046 [Emiliania huxleyi CCMP1516]|eukprot:XP_005793208.1 hypothetical protein EMIHUDRAFT_251046 [Emiliania huxleyi CCMP1516]